MTLTELTLQSDPESRGLFFVCLGLCKKTARTHRSLLKNVGWALGPSRFQRSKRTAQEAILRFQ